MQLTSSWDCAENVRRQVLTALADYPRDVRDAAAMTASELAENALKYGSEERAEPYAFLSLSADRDHLQISVASRASGESISALTERIEEVRNAPNIAALYLQRLQELMELQEGGGKLGLLRVAFEGQFELGYSFHEPFLTITAKRALS